MSLEPDHQSPTFPTSSQERAVATKWLAFGSFALLVCVFLPGQLIQFLNLPIGLFATSLLIFGTAGLILPTAFNQRAFEFTGLSTFRAGDVALAFFIGAVNLPFANVLMGVAKELLPRTWSELAEGTTRMLVEASGPTRLLIIAAAAVAAPIGEELFFRGWLQRVFGRIWTELKSALVVAVLFSAVHFDPVGFTARVELGLLFGLLRARTGSLWPSIAMHSAHNAVSTVALYWLTEDALKELDQPFEWGPALIWGALSLAATVSLFRTMPRRGVHDESPAPLQFRPQRALRLVALNLGLLVAVGFVLATFRDQLPGAHLTRKLQPASTPVESPAGPNP